MTALPAICPTRLISDAPSEEDAFGPHARVAKTIAELVGSEGGGKTIGLEGNWGSGKSTVINLLRKEFESEPNVAMIVFDAWAHQGDPLRRTFLERLITGVLQRKWADQQRWKERAEQLARRRRVSETRDTARLTDLAKQLSVAMFLVPFGIGLFAVGLSENSPISILGVVLGLSPLLVIAKEYLLHRGTQGGASSGDAEDAWALFASKQVTTTLTETFEAPDPTSVEFRQTFVELMNEALSDKNRKLMLVLDNLDRVDPDDAVIIWSTLQTFLQHSEDFDPSWFERVWVLIPYDPDGISRLWERQPSVGSTRGDGAGSVVAETASTFLDKSLQIRFGVPPPALSDWQNYLVGLLKEALPDHDPEQFHPVHLVYALYPGHQRSRPTPRDLKLYVNRIGALHRQWQDRFHLHQLAYYALIWRDARDVEKELRADTMPERELKAMLGEGMRDSIAALWFNVGDVEQARQLLLVDPMREAIFSGDGDSLKAIAEDNPAGFWPVLEWMWGAGEVQFDSPAMLAKAGVCFAKSGLFAGTLKPSMQSILDRLQSHVKEVLAWAPFDGEMAEGVGSILELLRADATLARAILVPITLSGIGEGNDKGGGEVGAEAWVDGILLVFRKLESLGLILSDVVESGLTVPTDAAGWMQVCDRLAQQDSGGHYWPLLRPKAPFKSIVEALSEAVQHSNFSQQHVHAIRVTNETVKNASWGPLAESLKETLQGGSSVPSPQLSLLLEAVWTVRKLDDSVEPVISLLATQGHILHQLNQAFSEGDDRAVAWSMFMVLDADPTGAEQPGVGNSAGGYQQMSSILTSPDSRPGVIPEFCAIVSARDRQELLFRILENRTDAKEFVVRALREAFTGPASDRVFTSEVVHEHWSLLKDELDEEGEKFRQLVARLVAERNLTRQIYEGEFDPGDAGLYTALVAAGGHKDTGFRQWCVEALGRIERQEWLDHLVNQDDVLGLVIELSEQAVNLSLGVHYLDALTDFAEVAARGQLTKLPSQSSWARVVEQLSVERRELLGRGALQAAINAGGNPAEPFFNLFGPEVSRSDVIENRGAVDRFFSVVLEKREEAGLSWLADLLDARASLLEEHPDKAGVSAFKERLRNAVDERPEGAVGESIARIATALGMEIPEIDEDQGETSGK